MPEDGGIRRRYLSTVLMTDIVGSTEHAAELGDSGWRDLVQQHHAVVRASLRRHGGREIDTAGDGFFAVFDAPAAAIDCALDVAQAVRKLGLEIRAGVHVGEVEQVAGKVGGIAVPIASRIMSAGGAGEVLVSATARDLAAGSGLTFEDRGIRELKGVPGEWHVYAVSLAQPQADEGTGFPTATERRAAAVRWSQARPIWQRRPRLAAGIAVVLAILVTTGGLLVWRPWQPPALAGLTENSVGVIDPDRDELIGQIHVGTRPGGIAVGEGSAWITNTDDDSVSQIDLDTRSVVNRIDVGRAPKGITFAEGSVWVANSGARTVSRINAAKGRVVQTIEVGNGPTAITAAGLSLWVANATDSTVVSIDARTGAVSQPTAVAAAPIALAADATGLWVASEDAASVSHLDPVKGVARTTPIQLAARPSALALDADSVWVASADGTVTRIDRSANRVTSTIDLHGGLTAILISDTAIWVGDHDGSVLRLDAANPASSPRRISTSSAVASMAVVDGDVWLAAQASAISHRGGTLRLVLWEPPRFKAIGLPRYANDPLSISPFTASTLEADGLVGYRHAGGTAGSALLPDLATSVPRPTNAGKTYAFQLRPNLVYSTGDPVRPADFLRSAERSFQVDSGGGAWGNFLYPKVEGADACTNDEWSPVKQCDLSAGILTDEGANAVTFNLSEPDPDFLFRLAHPAAYPVPERGVPMNELLDGEAFPGTGPYTATAATDTELRLARNPHFRVWNAEVRPDGFPNEIVMTIVQDDARRVAMVENGEADSTSFRNVAPTPELVARIRTQYPGQWHVGSVSTDFVIMNTSLPPFDNVDARRAVNFAIDRDALAPPDATVTCQVLPPGFPGYQPYCPYTVDPDAGGRWKAPDLAEGQRLVAASGTRGAKVVVGPTFPNGTAELEYLGEVLGKLGYKVSVDRNSDIDHIFAAWGSGRTQITSNGWMPDYLWPSTFLGIFTCGGEPTGVLKYCDSDFDRAFKHASDLQATDPAAAIDEWTALDHLAVDRALLAPMYNAGADFVSARVGNYQFNPAYAVLFDQMWVQ